MSLDINKIQYLINIFELSLNHQTTLQAGKELQIASESPEFLLYLIAILQEQQIDIYIRVAAACFFKNFIIQNWELGQESGSIISNEIREIVKNQIIDLMIISDSKVQIHLCEVISNITQYEYSNNMNYLISQLTDRLTENNVQANLGVLQTINSIFKRWRADYSTQELYDEAERILDTFGEPFLNFTIHTDKLIDQYFNSPQSLDQLLLTLNILLEIYQSLISQDIPKYLIDNDAEFQRILLKYLNYENFTYSSSGINSDDCIGNLEHVQNVILEIINLYIQKQYDNFPKIRLAVISVRNLITRLDSRPKFDSLASKALELLSIVVKNPNFSSLFGSPSALSILLSNIILPNVTLSKVDEMLFTNEPIEYIKFDLEEIDSETRRRSATDFALSLFIAFQKEWREIFSLYIHENFDLYNSDPVNNWKNKNTAIILLSSIIATNQATSLGVADSSEFIDFVNIFSTHVLPDLQPESQAHPILIADSIKYLLNIRNQLTAEQLYSMLQLLIFHLGSEDQLIYTYAATAIEQIFAITLNHKTIFPSKSLHPFLEKLLAKLFYANFKNRLAVQIAENDHIMKAIMRTIIIAGPEILPYSALLAEKLSDILRIITSNPSNPKYSHYTFEAIGACIRIAKNTPENFLQFELAFQDIFHLIITQSIEEFIPYTLQIFAQMLAFHPTQGIPDFYQSLLCNSIQPTLWKTKENTPGFARLLRSYLIKSSKLDTLFTQPNLLNSILGIFQNLISSRNTESYGFELAREIFIQIPIQVLQPYLKSIANLMLSRLQKSKTNNFIYEFTLFISVLLTVNKPDWNPDFVIGLFESIQKDLFLQLIQHFIINTITAISEPDNRKLVISGMICLLTQTKLATVSPLKINWSLIFSKVMALLELSETFETNIYSDLLQEEELIRFEIDETTFSTAFTNLTTSYIPPVNPAANISDIKAHTVDQLQIFIHENPEFVRKLAFLLTKAESSALINQFYYLGINV